MSHSGGGRGGGRGGSAQKPHRTNNSNGGGGGGGRGGFSSPSPHRGGRGGYQRGGYHGAGGGGGGGFTSPSPSSHFADFSIHSNSPGSARTPQRSYSSPHQQHQQARFTSPHQNYRQPAFGSPSFRGVGSPGLPPSSLVQVGEFGVDERAYKDSVSLSLKMGQAGLEDAHIESVVIVWMKTHLLPYIEKTFAGFPRDQLQVNIELQDNSLTSAGVVTLCNYLSEIVTSPSRPFRLTALKLWNCQISDEGCVALGRLLVLLARCDAPLLELHLSHNVITERGAAAIMSSVYEYARPDTTCTRLQTIVDASQPATTSSSSSSVAFILPPTCIDTGVKVSPPVHPLWLRLEWNCIEFNLFQSYFAWLNLEPNALKRAAKQQKRAAAKLQQQQELGLASTPLSRQLSEQSTDLETDNFDAASTADDQPVANDPDTANGAEELLTETPDADTELPSLENLSLDNSISAADATPEIVDPTPAVAAKNETKKQSLDFDLPPAGFRICPASNRQLCSVRMCKHSRAGVHIHLCFFQLQHQSYQSVDLLDVLQAQRQQRTLRKTAKPQPLSERSQSQASATAASASPAEPSPASASPATSPSDDVTASPADASTPAPAVARPLVLFLDTNSVFNMITARRESHQFNWNRLYELASSGKFGSCFAEPDRRVYLILCSAVLNEIDARKEYSKKAEGGAFGAQKQAHLSTLARQIKEQFQMSIQDQSQGFLAKCKNLGGVDQGFVKTISIAQGEMNVHPSMRPSASDTRNTSNDRRILNAALHWCQTVGETGVVLLLTDDRNLQNLAQAEGVPVVSLFALDRALARPEYAQAAALDSVTLRAAIASCSADLRTTLAHENAQPAMRMDRNVYECLADAVDLLTRLLDAPPEVQQAAQLDPDDARRKLEQWTGVLAHAPQLLTAIRQPRTSQSPP